MYNITKRLIPVINPSNPFSYSHLNLEIYFVNIFIKGYIYDSGKIKCAA